MKYLTEMGTDILSDVAEFCRREVCRQAQVSDKEHTWPEEIYAKASEMGLGALFACEEYGGLPLSLHDKRAILEEIAGADAGLAMAYMVNYISMIPVQECGHSDLKEYCSGKLTDGRFGCFCLSEDHAGSDIRNLKTKAIPEGEGYAISGTKAFVSNAALAGFYVVFAQMPQGMTAFVVDADEEGITIGPEENKLGLRNSSTREVTFNKVFVNKENMLGRPGDGKKIALYALDRGRAMCGVVAAGLADKALKISIDRARERNQFGRPLAESRAMQTKLAEMHMKVAAARSCCADALELIEMGEDCAIASATAKCVASEAACFCADEALQIYGGCGYCEDYPAEKLLRDARAFRIVEGTDEILRMNIGRILTDSI